MRVQSRLRQVIVTGGLGLALLGSAFFMESPARAGVPDFSQIESSPSTEPEFLPVEQAFQLHTKPVDGRAAVNLHWDIAPSYTLYLNRIQVLGTNPAAATAPLSFSTAPFIKNDPNFGKVPVFHNQADGQLALSALPTPASSTVQVQLQYQGCSDRGLCYPPVQTTVEVPSAAGLALASDALPRAPQAVSVAAALGAPQAAALPPAANDGDFSTPSNLVSFLQHASWPVVLLSLLIVGIGLAFTPCVFPMMPILSGLIAGEQQGRLSGWRGFQLSVAYVLGMASTYAVMGTLMGYFGTKANIQLWLQNPVVLVTFALLFVVLALGMFGAFTLQLPAPLRSWLDRMASQRRGGRLGSVAAMGALSALVVSPCVSAPLVGVLTYITTTGDAFFGGLALFALGLGMGIPLILIGTTSAELLPRAGNWMNAVKGLFGIGLLGVAVWLLSRVFAGPMSLVLWATLLAGAGVALGAFAPAPALWQRLMKAVGLGMLFYAGLLVVGSVTHQRDPLHPLDAFINPGSQGLTPRQVDFATVSSPAQLAQFLSAAQRQGKPALVDVSADWCSACQVMEHSTFRDSQVVDALAPYQRVRLDLSHSTPEQRDWLQSKQLYGPPVLLFMDRNGQEQLPNRIQGEVNAEELLKRLPSAA